MIINNKIIFNLVKFEDVFEENKKSKMKASEGGLKGKYKFFNCSKTQKLFSNEYLNSEESLLFSTGGSAAVHYCDTEHAYSTDVWSIRSKNTKYMYYYYKSIIDQIENCFQGAGLKHLSKKDFKNIIIKIPDDKTQENTINYLDKKVFNINSIKSLLEKIEIRNQYYADKLLSGELSIGEDGKISKIKNNFKLYKFEDIFKENKKSKMKAGVGSSKGKYKFFNCSKTQKLFSNEYLNSEESLLFSTGGNAAVHYCDTQHGYSTDVWSIKSNNTKYMYYYYKSKMEKIEDCFQGAGLKHLSKKYFKDIEIKIPAENIQNDIIQFLDKLEYEKSKIERLLELEEKRFEWLSDKLLSGEYIIED